MSDSVSRGSVEQQLGEVVGTVKMLTTTVDNLRQSIEKLTERAAFKSDVEAVKLELTQEFDQKIDDLQNELDKEKTKVSKLQTIMYMVWGGSAVLGFLFKFVDLGIRVHIGG